MDENMELNEMNEKNEQKVYEALAELGIGYEVYRHAAVFTVEEANEHCADIPGMGCKNLFLKDSKGKRHFLVVVPDEKTVDIKRLGTKIGVNGLGFASPERLMKFLGLTPGSVSPFGILNDEAGGVEVLADSSLLEAEQVTFHPNINTATVVLGSKDFELFLSKKAAKYSFLRIPDRD